MTVRARARAGGVFADFRDEEQAGPDLRGRLGGRERQEEPIQGCSPM